jgi:hypothetical protein
MDRPIDLLAAVGITLYGEDHWKQPFAQDLNINPETIRKWMVGRRELPADSPVLVRCADLLDLERQRLIDELRKIELLRTKLEKMAQQSPVEPTS